MNVIKVSASRGTGDLDSRTTISRGRLNELSGPEQDAINGMLSEEFTGSPSRKSVPGVICLAVLAVCAVAAMWGFTHQAPAESAKPQMITRN